MGAGDMTVPDYSSGPPPGPPPPGPGPPPPAPPVATPPTRRRGPKILIVVGGVLTAFGVIGFVAGFVLLGAELFETVDEGLDPTSELDVIVDVPGEGTVVLEPDRYQLVAVGPTLTGVSGSTSDAGGQSVHRLPFADPPVTVTGPDGAEMLLEPPTIDRLSRSPGLDSVGLSEFTVRVSGIYTIEIGGEPGPVTQVGVGKAETIWEEAAGFVVSAIVITVGSLLATLGFLLLVGGIIWWAVARNSPGVSATVRI